MAEALNILIVEDSEDDAHLLERQLERAGLNAHCERVDTAESLVRALDVRRWDLVLSDYHMPGFDGFAAFRLVRAHDPDLPYIFVSGHIGEERAAEAMRQGANDYVLKDNLTRLLPAIQRELREADMRRRQRATEAAYRASEMRAQSLLANVTDLILVITPEGMPRVLSDSVCRTLGMDTEALQARSLFERVHPDDQDAFRAALDPTADPDGPPHALEMRLADQDGDWRVLDVRVQNLCGVPLIDGFLLSARDVTERERMADALAAKERLLNTVFETLPHPLVVKDKAGRYLMVNPAWSRIYGLAPEHAVGRDAREAGGRPDTVIERIQKEDRQIMAAGGQVRTFHRSRGAESGTDRDWQIIRSPLLDEHGEVAGVVAISVDITDELDARREADLAFGRLFDAIESLPMAFLLFDADQKLLMWNQKVRELYPSLSQLSNATRYADWLQAEADTLGLKGELRAKWLVAQQDDSPGDHRGRAVQTSDGRWIQCRHDPTSEGGIVCLRLDLTEQKQREQELRQAQKMETLGQLTGGVAHDFNNLLQVIQGYCELGVDQARSNPKLLNCLEASLAAVTKASHLTQQLLAFSRKQVLNTSVTALPALVASCATMLRRMLPETITLEEAFPEHLRSVRVDRGMMEQVVMNLVINARDAMPAGGRIVLGGGHSVLSEGDCQSAPWAQPGAYVTLWCDDEGEGMTPEVLEHIFDPFFTTKGQGQGTGLGLSTVYGIVQQHHGLIQVTSRPGVGTRFTVHLPATDDAPEQAAGASDTLPRGEGTVLVVEDEDSVRDLTRAILEEHGYRILTAANGREAVDLVREHAAKIDLVLTDCVMPEMGGVEACEEIRRLEPSLPMVIMSGWQDVPDLARAERLKLRFLNKPFTSKRLLQTVQKELARPRVDPADT